MPENTKEKLKNFVCPYCECEIVGVEFRAFGVFPAIVMMTGCPKCLRPLPSWPMPPDPIPEKKSPIIA